MKQLGKPPFVVCSTRGYRAFSSFVAKIDGLSIDRQMKKSTFQDKPERDAFFLSLWRRYIAGNPDLAEVLCKSPGLFDPFAANGSLSVAEALWQIRSELLLSKTSAEITPPDSDEIVTESQILNLDKGSNMFPGLKLKEISVMVSSKKAINFNSIAFSYSVTAEAEPETDFLAAIEHIKSQLLVQVEADHADFLPSHSKSKSSSSSPSLGHVN